MHDDHRHNHHAKVRQRQQRNSAVWRDDSKTRQTSFSSRARMTPRARFVMIAAASATEAIWSAPPEGSTDPLCEEMFVRGLRNAGWWWSWCDEQTAPSQFTTQHQQVSTLDTHRQMNELSTLSGMIIECSAKHDIARTCVGVMPALRTDGVQ